LDGQPAEPGGIDRVLALAFRSENVEDRDVSSRSVDLRAVEARLRELEAADRFSGVVAVRRADQDLLSGAFGYASRTWEVPMARGMRFDSASITKVFTAVATLQLVESGTFDLDTPATEYLGLEGTGISAAVTPYHLLTHTSGIADDADEEAGERYEHLFRERPNYALVETVDFLPQFVGKPPNFPPGTGCRYCNAGYVLLGLMIERASGRSFRQYVTEHVFAPAGMASSGFFRMDVVERDIAEGVEPVEDDEGRVIGWRRNIYSYPPVGGPDGGAYVTVEDLLRFHAAVTEGQLLGPVLTAKLLSPKERHSTKGGRTRMMGFGFEFETDRDGFVRSYWKEGANVGTSGILQHYPAQGLTVAILAVGEDAAWEPLKLLDEAVRAARPP
jgi:CubicO group peptidase (beta-lactamase class C family)